MSKYFLFIFFFVNLIHGLFAQKKCDCKTDAQRFVLISQLLDLKEHKKASKELKQINTTDINCRIQYLQFQTQLFSQQMDLLKADSCLAVLENLVKSNQCEKNEGKYYLQAGFLLMKKHQYDSALVSFVKAQERAEISGDSLGQCNAMMYMGNIFNYMRQLDKATEYDKRALKIARALKLHKIEVRILSNLQGHFGVWYDLTEDLQFIDSAKKITDQTLELAKKYDLKAEAAQTFSVLSGIAFVEKKYKLELIYADSALMFLDRSKDFRFCHSVFQKKCDAYIELKDLKSAKLYADSSMYYAEKTGEPLSLSTGYERLYEVEKLMGHHAKALYYHERFTTIRDSIRTIDKTKVINEMEQKYNKAKNEKKINELAFETDILNKEKEISGLRLKSLVGIVVAIIFVLVAVIFFYRQSVIRNKLQKIETEQRLNRARMNPHFFFNVLASIQTMVLEEQDAGRSAIMISKFSKIMRQSLESTYTELVSIGEEEEFISNYLDIQRMRYENKFSYEIEIANGIDADALQVPGMLIQPFIENSIEHGFKDLAYEGKLTVKFELEEQQLKISCLDNGKGFRTAEKHKGYPSRATQIIKDRLALLNERFKTNSHFDLSTSENAGTLVIIYLPILKND